MCSANTKTPIFPTRGAGPARDGRKVRPASLDSGFRRNDHSGQAGSAKTALGVIPAEAGIHSHHQRSSKPVKGVPCAGGTSAVRAVRSAMGRALPVATRLAALILLGVLVLSPSAHGQQRFPPPDFESGYKQPELSLQTHQTYAGEAVSAALLVAVMCVGAWLLLRRRTRRGIFLLGLASLFYFGFYKGGCVCPIGAIQNITLALYDARHVVPVILLVVFMAPLVLALFCGRVFCGTACPLGAIQDVFLFRPVRTAAWLDDSLGLLRYFVLGLVVYFTASGGYFLMCRYDPFVSFFRFGGSPWLWLFGGGLLFIGLFIGRPFCRFLCPYGAVLSLAARWTATGVSVTPDDCINCSLCRDACPFGAIAPPRDEAPMSRAMRTVLVVFSIVSIVVVPVMGYRVSGRSAAGAVLGIWLGLVIVAKLLSVCMGPARPTFQVDHARCFSCGRCYLSCPRERARLKAKGNPIASS